MIAYYMNDPANTLITLENKISSITVDLFGGAITNFHLKENNINPLSFAFTKDQMPANNRSGAAYKGHFLCLGRWGEPSAGEINAGVPNHGEPANILWSAKKRDQQQINMQVNAVLEGFHVERKVVLDKDQPVFAVSETIKNINPLGRLYNMVQHPTIAAPFLDNKTIVDSNASIGFDQGLYKYATKNILQWHFAKDPDRNTIDLRTPTFAYNAVFSFIIEPEAKYGWITAFSPTHHLLFGYLWKRNDYPWIHLWQHWDNDAIQYRGLEFGTAGIHQPFKEILETATTLFEEKTFAYIDAGETVSKNYLSFICETGKEFAGVEQINVLQNSLVIQPKGDKADIIIHTSEQLIHELSK